jgi:segregation and condensation protein B
LAEKTIREIIEAALNRIKLFRRAPSVPAETIPAQTAVEESSSDNLSDIKLKGIIEAALMAAGKPLPIDKMLKLFLEDEQPERADVRRALESLSNDYVNRPIELLETAAGFRINVRADYATWVSRLWEERPPKYSRALLETLSLVAYRQPITRGEIEDVRGVSVSSSIIKTLMERHWIKEVGHRDVPGRPALLATTKEFLNYFGLKSLDELPTLSEIKDMDSINRELDLEEPSEPSSDQEGESETEDESTEQSAEIVKLDLSQNDSSEQEEDEAVAETEPEPDPEAELEPEPESDHQGEKESE